MPLTTRSVPWPIRAGSAPARPSADARRALVGGALLTAALTAAGCHAAPPSAPDASETPAAPPSSSSGEGTARPSHPYVGMWVTADGHIRQELLPGGRYDEARGGRETAYTGDYTVSGDHIDYTDDTGFTATGTFDGDVLHHGGYVLYREGSAAHRRARNGEDGGR